MFLYFSLSYFFLWFLGYVFAICTVSCYVDRLCHRQDDPYRTPQVIAQTHWVSMSALDKIQEVGKKGNERNSKSEMGGENFKSHTKSANNTDSHEDPTKGNFRERHLREGDIRERDPREGNPTERYHVEPVITAASNAPQSAHSEFQPATVTATHSTERASTERASTDTPQTERGTNPSETTALLSLSVPLLSIPVLQTTDRSPNQLPDRVPAWILKTTAKGRNRTWVFGAIVAAAAVVALAVTALILGAPTLQFEVARTAVVGLTDYGVRVRISGEARAAGGWPHVRAVIFALGAFAGNGTVELRGASPVEISGPELAQPHHATVWWPAVPVDFGGTTWPFEIEAKMDFGENLAAAGAAAWAARVHKSVWQARAQVRAAATVRGWRIPLPEMRISSAVAMGPGAGAGGAVVEAASVTWASAASADAIVRILPDTMERRDIWEVTLGSQEFAVSDESVRGPSWEIPAREFRQWTALQWAVAVRDCAGRLVQVGQWHSAPANGTRVSVHGHVESVPELLARDCADGASPLNRVASGAPVVVWATGAKNPVPRWLWQMLRQPREVAVGTGTLSGVPVEVNGGSFGAGADLADVVYVSVVVDLQKTESMVVLVEAAGHFAGALAQVEMAAEAAAQINTSSVDVTAETTVVSGGGNASVAVRAQTEVGVGAARALAAVVNGFFSGAPLQWRAEADAKVELPLVSTTLKNVTASGVWRHGGEKNESEAGSEVNGREDGGKDDSINIPTANLSVVAQRIFYIESSPSSLELLADVELHSALNASVVLDVSVAANLAYNNTVVGSAWVEGMHMAQGTANFSVGVRLECPDDVARNSAEDFASHLISGAAARVTLPSMRANHPAVNAFVAALATPQVAVPQVRFHHIDDRHFDESGRGFPDRMLLADSTTGSPFLVGAIIHLLSSQIEITVYNPLANAEIAAEIVSSQASFEGQTVARIDHSGVLLVPPGLWTTPRMPIHIEAPGAALLRRALNRNLAVDTIAQLAVRVGKFPMNLLYSASGLTAEVRL